MSAFDDESRLVIPGKNVELPRFGAFPSLNRKLPGSVELFEVNAVGEGPDVICEEIIPTLQGYSGTIQNKYWLTGVRNGFTARRESGERDEVVRVRRRRLGTIARGADCRVEDRARRRDGAR